MPETLNCRCHVIGWGCRWKDELHLCFYICHVKSSCLSDEIWLTRLPVSLFCSLHLLLFTSSHSPSLEGEESGGPIEAPVWGGGQEKAPLPAFVPSHARALASRPGRRGNRSRPASAPPPSPPRPLRFLPHGLAGASRFLSHRERHVGGHRAGAFAQKVRFSGHQLPQVSPGNPGRQRAHGPPA